MVDILDSHLKEKNYYRATLNSLMDACVWRHAKLFEGNISPQAEQAILGFDFRLVVLVSLLK